MNEFKASRGPGTGRRPYSVKFKPPTDEEKRNHNRRIIDGKAHYYDVNTKRWIVLKNQPQQQAQQQVNAAQVPAPALAPAPSANVAAELTPAQQLALANVTHMMQQAFANLATQLKES